MSVIILTAKRLRQVLQYLHETGEFKRIEVHRNQPQHLGKITKGSITKGYYQLGVDGNQYFAHRLAFLWMTGEFPSDDVDHIDCDPKNNKWSNLRQVPRAMNIQNQRGAHRDNKAGFLGVSPFRSGFRAGICIGERRVHIGTFPTPELAHEAYIKAKRLLHKGCTL